MVHLVHFLRQIQMNSQRPLFPNRLSNRGMMLSRELTGLEMSPRMEQSE